jgi:HAD superfamily hydrolase (TIGR01509 family)
MKAVLFDFDGTLADTGAGLARSLNHARKHYGLSELSVSDACKHVGRGQENLIQGGVVNESGASLSEAVDVFKVHYREHILDDLTWFPEIGELLDLLLARKVKTGIISNKSTEFLLQSIKHLGDFPFDIVLGGDGGLPKKPAPDMVVHAVTKLGVDKSETLYVGDSTMDVEAGLAAGVQVAAVTWGLHTRQDLERCKPHYLIDTVAGLRQIV